MFTINTNSKNTFGTLINNTLSDGYKLTSDNLVLTVTLTSIVIPSHLLENETNFYLSTDPENIPGNIVNGKLVIKFPTDSLSPDKFIGFRLSNTEANDNFNYNTATAGFSTDSKSIAANTSSPLDSIIWATGAANTLTTDEEGNIIIDADISYSGNTPGESSPFSVEIFEVDDTSAGTPENIGSTSKSSDDADLSITAFSAEITPVISSLDPNDFSKAKTNFFLNNPVVLKTVHTTNANTGYKPISKLVIDETVTADIAADTLYMTTNESITSKADLDADATTTVKVDLESLPAEVTYSDGVIKITMEYVDGTGTFDALFTNTDNTLPAVLNAYIFGTITGAGSID